MLSAIYYLFLVLLCTFFMILSAVALVVCRPFDPCLLYTSPSPRDS